MRRIYVKDLRAGQVLPKALFTTTGLKLLPAGTRLSRSRMSSLRRAYVGPLYLASSYAEIRAELAGETYLEPVVPIEPVSGVRRKLTGEEQMLADARREWMREIRRTERAIDEQIDIWSGLERHIEPALRPMELAEAGRLGWPTNARLRAYRADRVGRIAKMHRAIMNRQIISASEPLYLVRELIDLFTGYPDRFARLATIPVGDEHPSAEHALRVGALACAIAVQMGWSVFDAQRAGLAGIFADLGMVLEPLDSRGTLDEVAASRLRRHPIASAVMLESIEDIPEPVRLAVAQHHERMDGTGYPLGARGPQIHEIARVLAVADSFAAAITPRQHRSGKRPHAALVDVCTQALRGTLDRRATMALVRVTGIFPVGASVALDTGDAAVVVSNHADSPGRPTLRVIRDVAGGGSEVELDLKREESVRITAELAAGEHQMSAA